MRYLEQLLADRSPYDPTGLVGYMACGLTVHHAPNGRGAGPGAPRELGPLDGSLSLDEVCELARTAPKIAVDDPRVATTPRKIDQTYIPFGNNFFTRFIGMRAALEGRTFRDHPYAGYAQDVEDRGISVRAFYDDNQELCQRIFEALDGLEPYQTILEVGLGLVREGRLEDLDRLRESVGHPWGIEAISTYAWDRL